jgi:uncharacterized protein (TIGR02265 family)
MYHIAFYVLLSTFTIDQGFYLCYSEYAKLMSENTPTIKGIFLKSHINGIRKEKGEEGIRLLEQKYGKPLDFKNTDNVPVREEVHLLECAVEILSDEILPKEKVSYESGRLHFKNFLTTPIAKIIFPYFKNQFKLMIMNAQNIEVHIFERV